MQISGGNFPPGQLRQSLANIVGITKLILLAIIILGDKLGIFEKLQITPPPIYTWANQNKVKCLLFFISFSYNLLFQLQVTIDLCDQLQFISFSH